MERMEYQKLMELKKLKRRRTKERENKCQNYKK